MAIVGIIILAGLILLLVLAAAFHSERSNRRD